MAWRLRRSERDKMLAGDPNARAVSFFLTSVGANISDW